MFFSCFLSRILPAAVIFKALASIRKIPCSIRKPKHNLGQLRELSMTIITNRSSLFSWISLIFLFESFLAVLD